MAFRGCLACTAEYGKHPVSTYLTKPQELIRHGGMPSRNYQVLASLPQLSTVAVDLQGTYQSAQVKMALEQHLPGVRIEPAA